MPIMRSQEAGRYWAVDKLTKKTPFVEAGPNDKPPT
jgi:hypothetical protein